MSFDTQKTQTIEGNTKTSIVNTNDNSRCRKWHLVLNNYTDEEYKILSEHFIQKGWTYVIGKEIGEENKTPHLQMFVEHKNAISFKYLKKLNSRMNIRKARGNKEQNFQYCSKDGDFITNIKMRRPVKDPLKGKTYKPFQEEIINIINTEPDDRVIYWYWEPDGNVGKTTLAKHICLKEKNRTLFLGGKGSDIKYGVKSFIDNKENDLNTCIFHFTRSIENYISYEALESIKDGIFYNSKYESGMVLFNSPHVICFANYEPDTSKLSNDRWVIKKLTPTDLNIPPP